MNQTNQHSMGLEHTLHMCTSKCNQALSQLFNMPDINMRGNQFSLLRDCIQICDTTALFLSGNSPFTNELTKICARICEACGNECKKHSDMISQDCATMCLNCANECRQYMSSRSYYPYMNY